MIIINKKEYNEKDSIGEIEASPQIEDGHIDIANELVEALAKTQLSGYESRILWALWRQTWGYALRDKKGKYIKDKKNGWILKRKSAVISSNTWVELTGLNKYNVSRTLRELGLRGIVIKFDNKSEWGFQKHYNQWLQPIRKVVIKNDNTYFVTRNDNVFIKNDNKISKIDNKNLPKAVFYRLFLTPKKLLKKDNKERRRESSNILNKKSIPFQLAIYLEGKIRENNKRVKKKTDSQLAKWAEDIEKLIRIDEAPPVEIGKVIDWVVEDSFWSVNILSAEKLREHYPKLYKKAVDRGKGLKESFKDDRRFDDLE